ncbi:MAG TPA: NAD(P)-binding protein [Planctomycetota bacterium]|nr:NAD(P)-binding protein [Planctomycetota bacterium]
MALIISGIELPVDHPEGAELSAAVNRLLIGRDDVQAWRVERRSVDAREKGNPRLVCSVWLALADPDTEPDLAKRYAHRQVALVMPGQPWMPEPGAGELRGAVVVVGAGPAGLAAAWRLAAAGYRPLVLERGEPAEKRPLSIVGIEREGRLDPESNYSFGEGGAGCFSDGKLHTRRSDPRTREFLELLVSCGAPEETLTDGRPHVGSDRLPGVVRRIREKIAGLGGAFRFGARVEDFEVAGGRLAALKLAGGERMEVGSCILAAGASARDTFAALARAGVALEARPVQCGLRLECPQEEIDRLLYGRWAGHERLGPAEFFLTSAAGVGPGAAAAHTFCMCPGGRVVPVATEPGMLSTNGASHTARDSGFANAAVIAAVAPEDFGASGPLAGIEFQRALERRIFERGGGDYSFPCATVKDFLGARGGSALPAAPRNVRRKAADLAGLLPPAVEAGVRRALERFARLMPPLGGAGAVLYGAETRVGSPVRVLRGEDGQSPAAAGLYPAGEGSGYAAGIVTSAVDGMRAAELLVAAHRRP